MDDIDGQIDFLREKLNMLREQMPETPLDAEKKAMEVGLIEEQLAELYEIKGSENTKTESDGTLDELSEQIASITDEIMGLEIRMQKADMNNNESEKSKLQLSANALKSRRQTLIDEVKSMKASSAPKEDDLSSRVTALEKEVSDLKALVYQLLTR